MGPNMARVVTGGRTKMTGSRMFSSMITLPLGVKALSVLMLKTKGRILKEQEIGQY
jgi:hypothetical protein